MNEKTTLYYDGYCNLCNTWMNIIKRADRKKSILFIPLQSEEGRKNFGVVTTKIKWMEWLWLNSSGHRRANFVYDEAGAFTANWLVP